MRRHNPPRPNWNTAFRLGYEDFWWILAAVMENDMNYPTNEEKIITEAPINCILCGRPVTGSKSLNWDVHPECESRTPAKLEARIAELEQWLRRIADFMCNCHEGIVSPYPEISPDPAEHAPYCHFRYTAIVDETEEEE